MQAGQKVRDYVFEEKIGAGGMGEVWRALHTVLQRRVAIKAMAPQLASDPELEQRFIQEARAQAALDHPRILHVTDFFSEGGVYYLVMRLIHGVSLEAHLARSGEPLALAEVVKIAHDVLEGLDYAHRHGIIHRDVKPSNILLDASGHACVHDFGIALLVGQDRRTRTGASLGTPHYMSPEQIQRPRKIDHRADVYSAGCVIYEMLAGRPPFDFSDEDADTSFLVQQAHVNQVPEPVRKWNPAVPLGIDAVILRALEKDPGQRWNGCGEFLRALEARRSDTLVEDSGRVPSPAPPVQPPPVPPPAPTPLPVPPPQETRPRSWVPGAVLGGLALVVLIAVLFYDRPGEEPIEEPLPMDTATAEPVSTTEAASFAAQTPYQPAPAPVPLPESTSEEVESVSTDFSKVFRGTVDRFRIEMQLTRSGEELSGRYLYPSENFGTRLVGTVDGQGEFTIDEYDDNLGGTHTGIFRGRFIESSPMEMQGTWSRPNKPKSFRFQLQEELGE